MHVHAIYIPSHPCLQDSLMRLQTRLNKKLSNELVQGIYSEMNIPQILSINSESGPSINYDCNCCLNWKLLPVSLREAPLVKKGEEGCNSSNITSTPALIAEAEDEDDADADAITIIYAFQSMQAPMHKQHGLAFRRGLVRTRLIWTLV